uniref:Uncharacterized protein n=1 Tax=Kwoniella dejecticola CBS 10117 TaxID=1296121 RepID=A0A1A6AGP6_9TREE|nr:uncharacterized protein I303_01057 [Kwoniella dejecticola CBS 10117]OBR89232.1 hypothetical protein I303_01057 [Kwoniella dejecticola CBS 10117]
MYEEPEEIPRLPTPPSPLPQPTRSRSESFRPRRPGPGAAAGDAKNLRSFSHSSRVDLSDWEIEELEELHRAGGRGRKRDKPTSPIVVVYDLEDLLPTSSPFRQSHSPPSSMDVPVPSYPHMPYGFPPIPNPIPSNTPSAGSGTSWWRMIVGILLYPIYLIATIIITPLPLLLNLLYFLSGALLILLYPIIGLGKVLYQAFVLGPAIVLGRILEAFYPLWVLVGAVIFFGGFMGLSTGWIGRVVLNTILRWKERRAVRAKKAREKEKKERERRRLDLLFEQYDEIERMREAERERHAKEVVRRERENVIKNALALRNTSTNTNRNQNKMQTPRLNIGMSRLRGTQKDERRERELRRERERDRDRGRDIFASTGRENINTQQHREDFERDFERKFNTSSPSPSPSSASVGSASSGSGGSNGIRTPHGPPQPFGVSISSERFDTGLRRTSRRLTSEEHDKLVRGEEVPVVVGMRRRGIKETYLL